MPGGVVNRRPLRRERALAATEELNARVFAEPGLGAQGVDRLVEVFTAPRRDAGDFT